jgi:hypothetical protein
VSIGEGDQLSLFLEKNPKVPKELMLVDDYSFAAYNRIGLGKIGDDPRLAIKGTKNMKAPNVSREYLSNAMKLAPIPKKFSFKIPEGVTRLGGTFGVDGNKMVYLYEDGVPGDHPNPADVLAAFK